MSYTKVTVNEGHMREMLRIDIMERRLTQAGWAKKHGFSAQFITDVLSGRRNVTAKLAKAMGYERAVIFVREVEIKATTRRAQQGTKT